LDGLRNIYERISPPTINLPAYWGGFEIEPQKTV
jgi:hypothetical protein